MKRRILMVLAAAVLALAARPGAAQETLPGTTPVSPPVPTPPPATEQAPAPPTPPSIQPGCGIHVLRLDHRKPVNILVPRPVPFVEHVSSLQVVVRPEKRIEHRTVIKWREVDRVVPCTVMKPVTETCPGTGECKTTWVPCTEMKTVKEREYYAVPVDVPVMVDVPSLQPLDIVVPRTDYVLENIPYWQVCPEYVIAPGPTGRCPRYEITPPECHGDHPVVVPPAPAAVPERETTPVPQGETVPGR
jgi:hypothetical protein